MCGIFGFTVNNGKEFSEKEFGEALSSLVNLSERRGREAGGVAIASNGRISIYKQPKRASRMLKRRDFSAFLSGAIGAMPLAVIGHTRLVTSGSQVIRENNQPVAEGGIVGVHNGIITNEDDILARYPDLKKSLNAHSNSDTRILFGLMGKLYRESQDMAGAIRKAYSEILGSASIALFSKDAPVLALATNTGSVYYSHDNAGHFFVFASERYIVEQFIRRKAAGLARLLFDGKWTFAKHWNFAPVRQLAPLSGALIDFSKGCPEGFSLSDTKTQNAEKPQAAPKENYEIVDVSLPSGALGRCTRCVLPHTYPFITFNEEGVCNYCLEYEKQKFMGRDKLEAILSQYRSTDGRPDCLVGFSGGRDSSYGLHILKKELGMHPIAYTYDWALVTDRARRNQARVTGELGVELITRAADIHTKRRHIRKNIYAWLKKPHLGMVPIFMAGDKMFYYYGAQLRKETGIKLTIFAAGHQLEQMEFKFNFCGVNQRLINNTKLYHYKMWVKMRLAMWYAAQYLTNPSYINESLFDNIFAFYSSFINKDDYLYLYRYIPWDEKVIEQTLKEKYGWETDDKYGKNQWRMGDGQTAFINYIYHTVAGFSEFDNFRSNQIREGLITRREALGLIKEDNRPRFEMLEDFAKLIGFNLEDVLLRIDAVPKLY